MNYQEMAKLIDSEDGYLGISHKGNVKLHIRIKGPFVILLRIKNALRMGRILTFKDHYQFIITKIDQQERFLIKIRKHLQVKAKRADILLICIKSISNNMMTENYYNTLNILLKKVD
jgi:hypothetical protein